MKQNKNNLIPVNVITGFLGSGKTTLLRRLLKSKAMSNTAVLINEFGEIGLDHELIEHIDENTVMLQSGCICCTIRDDLTSSLLKLLDQRFSKEINFNRVILETTGLADPSPIIYSIYKGNLIKNNYRLSNIVTTVDSVNGLNHIKNNIESVKQITVSDNIIITKTDISKEQLIDLKYKIKNLNPSAPIVINEKNININKIFKDDFYSVENKTEEVKKWIEIEDKKEEDASNMHSHSVNRHSKDIYSFNLSFFDPINWTTFGIWLTMLLHYHGENILRVKGILNIRGSKNPVAIHGVQHLIHEPTHLKSWPSKSRESKIVFIIRNIKSSLIIDSLKVFNNLGEEF